MEDQSKAVPKAVERYLERLKVDTIFGAPQQQGELTVIPVAEVHARLGYGFGGGTGPAPANGANADDEASAIAAPTAGGSGAGAGGTGSTLPRGFIELGPDGARWVPIENREKVAVAGIALAAWVVFWGTYTARTIVKAIAKSAK